MHYDKCSTEAQAEEGPHPSGEVREDFPEEA